MDEPDIPRMREAAIEALEKVRLARGEVFIRRDNANPQRLRELLADPLTEDQAGAVQAVLHAGVSLDDFDAWLADQTQSWAHLETDNARRRREETALESLIEQERRSLGISGVPTFWEKSKHDFAPTPENAARIAAAKRKYAEQALSCTTCGAEPARLTWFYHETPPSTWKRLCGRAGWMTYCEDCRERVDFFIEILN